MGSIILKFRADYKTIKNILKKETDRGLKNNEIDDLFDYITEDKNVFNENVTDDTVRRLFGVSESFDMRAYAAWEAQRLRGVVARKLGYQAVEMLDETGTSYLIFPVVETEPLHPGENRRTAAYRIYAAWREIKLGGDPAAIYAKDLLTFSHD